MTHARAELTELIAADDVIRQVIIDLEIARHEAETSDPDRSKWLGDLCVKLEDSYRTVRQELNRIHPGY
jgi:hypothetical protein